MAIARTLYSAQQLTIANGSNIYVLPVQSASCETTIPTEHVAIMGSLGSAGRHQKEVSTCKSDIKTFLAATFTAGSPHAGTHTDVVSSNAGAFLKSLIDSANLNQDATIKVEPGGFTMTGIISNIGIEIQKGNFAMLNLSFSGVGVPTYAPPTALGGASISVHAVTPVFSNDVKVYSNGVLIASDNAPSKATFSIDIPNEVVSNLGSAIKGAQADVSAGNQMFTKPPFKSNLSVDGLSLDVGSDIKKVVFGSLSVNIVDAQTASKGFNQAAGEAGATYSLTVEGTYGDTMFS